MTITKCRSCGADVCWVKSEKTGKSMILDAAPVDNGNITLALTGLGVVGDKTATGPRYISHFATCPQAKHWRKP
jgi:hypothetical protein